MAIRELLTACQCAYVCVKSRNSPETLHSSRSYLPCAGRHASGLREHTGAPAEHILSVSTQMKTRRVNDGLMEVYMEVDALDAKGEKGRQEGYRILINKQKENHYVIISLLLFYILNIIIIII